MTVYEQTQERIAFAKKMITKFDGVIKVFWYNALFGFEIRLEKMTIEEAGKIALWR